MFTCSLCDHVFLGEADLDYTDMCTACADAERAYVKEKGEEVFVSLCLACQTPVYSVKTDCDFCPTCELSLTAV